MSSQSENLPNISIKNEYDLQHILFPIIRTIFKDARTEIFQDTGHHGVRKDIAIDSLDIVIELKCTRHSMNERQLWE